MTTNYYITTDYNYYDNIVVSSCDEVYFREHGKAFLASAFATNTPVLIHVISPSKETLKILEKLSKKYKLSWSVEDLPNNEWSETKKRIYYASRRIYIADFYWSIYEPLNTNIGILILDVDSIIRWPIDWSLFKAHICLWDRSDENLGSSLIEKKGMKIISNLFSRPTPWFKEAYNYIENKNFGYWFLDQEALYETWNAKYKHLSSYVDDNNQTKTFNLREMNFIDWDFTPSSVIWSGKGNRKYTKEIYIDELKKYTTKFTQYLEACDETK